MTEPNRDRTSAMPLVIAGVIFAGVLAIWLPYMRSGGFQEGVTQPGVNTTPANPDEPVMRTGRASHPALDPQETPPSAVPETPEPVAERQSAAPGGLRAQVVDQDTGEVLPYFDVTLFDPNQGRSGLVATTNAQGQAHWATVQKQGKLRFLMSDQEKLRRPKSAPFLSRTFDPDGSAGPKDGQAGPFELTVTTGPTCWLECELPDGYAWSDFSAQLTSGRVLTAKSRGRGGYPSPVRPPMPGLLHPKLPWVRFHLSPRFFDLGWVQVTSSDNRWKGGAWLTRLQGQNPKPLPIRLQPATHARGHFACDTMEEQDWVVVRLEEMAPTEAPLARRSYDGGADSDGQFRFENIEPGEYILRTVDKAWFPFETQVTVRPGDNDFGSFALRARRKAGRIAGRVTSTSGSFEGVCHISLSGVVDVDGAPFDHSLDWKPDATGQLFASFAFEDVTEGDWYLYVHCHDGFTWKHAAQVVQAPATDIEIRLDDPTASLEIALHDAESGLPLEDSTRLSWWRHSGKARIAGPPFVLLNQQLPLQGITFRTSYPGYQPVSGDEATLAKFETSESTENHRKYSIPLKAGWGCLLQVRDRTHGHPVPKVSVWLDDLFQGHTNDRGEITLGLPTPPKSLRLEKDGWRWVSNRELKVQQGAAPLKPKYEFGLLAFLERL